MRISQALLFGAFLLPRSEPLCSWVRRPNHDLAYGSAPRTRYRRSRSRSASLARTSSKP